MFSKRMNSTRASADIHDLVGLGVTAKLVQRVMPARYLLSLPRRSGFCQQSTLGGMVGSGLSRMLRRIGTFCGADQVLPLSSLKMPCSQPVWWKNWSVWPMCWL